LINLV